MAPAPALRRRRSTARGLPAAERAAAVLRSAVRNGVLEGGARVNQQEWADQLGISRAALRESLELLTAEKLLQHEGHRGYFVAAFDVTEVREIYWLRAQVEREVLLSCRTPGPEEAAELAEACHAALAAADAGDRPDRFAAERRFFVAIYALSPFRFLRSEATRLWDLAETYRSMVGVLPPAGGGAASGNLAERRLVQLEAVCSGDRWTLVESVLGERRRMVAALDAGVVRAEPDSSLRWA